MLAEYEVIFERRISEIATADDPAHDLLHFKRVVAMAKKLGAEERAQPEIFIPAAWLHDYVIVSKDDPRRKLASRMSAEGAVQFLKEIRYPEQNLSAISHAIEAHSFSAGVAPQTLEAKVVQDADRLDALGAIGIARCFATAGLLKRAFYSAHDPFCEAREADDHQYTVDHFYRKLFQTAQSLQTESGRSEGVRRLQIMKAYLNDLKSEIFYNHDMRPSTR